MGIYTKTDYSKYFKSLQEVEKTIDGETEDLSADDASSTSTDYTADADENLTLPDDEEETESEPVEGDTEDEPDSDNETEDYTADADDVLSDPTSDDASMSGDDADEGGDSDQVEETPPTNKSDLQNLEMELFSDLTPEQINIKHFELKKQYIELYNKTEDIIDRINTIPKTEQNMQVINFVVLKLSELREMINYYLNNVYSTKTYTENTINYQQYLAVLNAINKILNEISTEND